MDSLRVDIVPAKSAYFAGESFQVFITFVNTRQRVGSSHKLRPASVSLPVSPASPLNPSPVAAFNQSQQQQQNAQAGRHPRTPLSASFASLPKEIQAGIAATSRNHSRKGLIGKDRQLHAGAQGPTRSLYPTRRLPNSHRRNNYSIALLAGSSTPDLADLSAHNAAMSYMANSRAPGRPLRQFSSKSLQNLQSTASSTSLQESDAEEFTPRNSVDFYNLGRNESMDSVLRDSVTDFARPGGLRRYSSGLSPGPSPASASRLSSLASTPESEPIEKSRNDTQHLLWAFAQLQGSFQVDETLVKPAEFVAVKEALFGNTAKDSARSGSSGIVGGGSLDTPTEASSSWRSWLWNATPPAVEADANRPSTPKHSRTPSTATAVTGGAQGGGSLADRRSRAMSDKSVPILSVPPSVFAIDLALGPGESKTYSYALKLPYDLPPSYRGKAIKFNYDLLVGTNRGGNNQQSRLFHLPLRINNHVAESGSRPFYDLTNPIIWMRGEADVSAIDEEEVVSKASITSVAAKLQASVGGRRDFDEYSARLLQAVLGPAERAGNLPQTLSPDATPFDERLFLSPSLNDLRVDTGQPPSNEGQVANVLESIALNTSPSVSAIEMVSRTSSKASFDIKKDGYLVASVVFAKSAFRLGETLQGIVAVNTGDATVLRVSARLETHEQVETTISVKRSAQVRAATKRLHCEHHQIAMDTSRVALALAIPSGGTPDFATSGVKLQWTVRLAFLIIPPKSPSTPVQNMHQEAQHRRTPSHAGPLQLANGQHMRSKSFAFGSDPIKFVDPIPILNGTHHIMPVPAESSDEITSYRGIPDIAFAPILFQSAEDAVTAAKDSPKVRDKATMSPTALWSGESVPEVHGSVVLMPGRTETIECSIPIKVYPSCTPFEPATGVFFA